MPSYLALYTLNAVQPHETEPSFDMSYTLNSNFPFAAENDNAALQIAERHKSDLSKDRFKPIVRLDDLFEVRRVSLPRDDIPF